MQNTTPDNVVIGLGKSGFAAVTFMASKGLPVCVMDTREAPPFAQHLTEQFPNVLCVLGKLDQHILNSAKQIIVSPGLSLNTPEIQTAQQLGVKVVGDVQIFVDFAQAPIIAITGSNAKSTVTTLLGEMAKNAGVNVAVGGNLGTPALELLADDIELYVMELSSFQLDGLTDLSAKAACILNISPDHLDRYDSYEHYQQSKQRVFLGCQTAIVNRDDALTYPHTDGLKQVSFGLNEANDSEFGLIHDQGKIYLAKGKQYLLDSSELKIKGSHNRANALSALALGEAAGLPMTSMLETLKTFPGLEHRCQWVKNVNGVDYFNDSKGTNVGATLAALEGLGPDTQGEIILLAGGDGKGADFAFLASPVKQFVKTLVAYGRDKLQIESALADSCHVIVADTFEEALQFAKASANEGDAVLLSPACASFDMFKSFEHRGQVFCELVNDL